jgi:hypothetical protein
VRASAARHPAHRARALRGHRDARDRDPGGVRDGQRLGSSPRVKRRTRPRPIRLPRP